MIYVDNMKKTLFFFVFFFAFFPCILIAQAQKRFVLTAEELNELEKLSESLAQSNSSLKKKCNALSNLAENLKMQLSLRERSLVDLKTYLREYESETNKKILALNKEIEVQKNKYGRLKKWFVFFLCFSIFTSSIIAIAFFIGIKKKKIL